MKFKCFSCFRSQSNDGVGKPRELYFGNQTLNSDKFFPTNFISTSKYTLLTFLPVALLLQFRRYANIYFLITAILQTVPQISPLTPATAWIPLIFVLGLSMVREGIEDYNRHKSDLELNSMICSVYREGSFQKVQWADVIVGDIVLCEEQETFPSDLVVLATSLENGNCYIETSSLDGEKNLKPKLAPKETSDKFIKQGDKAIFRLEGKISCEAPNPSLHSFSGTFSMRNLKVSLGVKQLLLRGAVLKNTKWILGIAVYTGLETRIMLNSNPSRYKQSQIEKRTNNLILLVFSLQLVCCLICAVCAGYFYMNNENAPYLYKIYGTALEGFLNYFTYFLLNNTMIPISLIVSLEMVKMLQAFFIQGDTDLYDLEKNRYAKAFTTSINEELGQIEYIFSDKTGTLTCNKMEFKLAMIGTEMYGDRRILKEKSSIQRKPTYVDKKEGVVFSFEDKKLDALMRREWELTGSEYPLIQNTNLSYEIKNSVTNETVYVIKTQYDLANEFFKLLSTCHECVIDSEKNKDMNMIRYQGPSPDEITLVDTARHLGFTFLGSSTTAMQVEWLGQKQTIDLLKLFEFNSDRKRMSVIIRENGIIKLYCKGADSIMKERLTTHHPQPFLAEIDKKLDDFSKRGLRTLVLAFKILSEKEYEEFNKQYNALVEHEQREKEINKITDILETEMYLLGATAVEDKLQDLVPETIHDFLQANIKVWMLTGDKMETAENIGRSCNLVQDHFAVLRLNFRKEQGIPLLKEKLQELVEITQNYVKIKKHKAFILEGPNLGEILKSFETEVLLIQIVQYCEAVICCRVTPKQKADVVKLVKKHLNKITLSIGDGANDVNMIQEAHIGIGLYGEEGMRAVQASDFAFVKFNCLWKLILVHGKWSYIRISEMILYFFYKNMVFTVCQFYFSFVCGWSGETVYDDYYITFYNLIFTALPVIVRAVIEQDIYYRFPVKIQKEDMEYEESLPYEENKFLKKYYPKLYYIGQKNTLFTYTNFFIWVFQGLVHGLLIFLFNMYIFSYHIANADGYTTDLWIMSITLYTSIILVVDLKIAVHTQYWTLLSGSILIFSSLILYFSYIWISDQFQQFQSYKTASMLFQTASFYLTAVVCAGIVFAQDLAILYWKVENQHNLIERVKIGVKMGYDKSETFFKNIFASKDVLGSEKSELKKISPRKDNSQERALNNNEIKIDN